MNLWRKRGVAILLYHRIAAHIPDPQKLCVTQENFWEQIRRIKQRHTIIGPEELRDALRAKRVPRGAVMLTFDDGYADNLWSAAPVLRDHEVPATFFIISGTVGQAEPLPHDRIARRVLCGDVPHEFEIVAGGERHHWQINGCPPQLTAWDIEAGHPPNPRQQCYLDLHRLTRPMDGGARAAVLEQLAAEIPADAAMDQPFRMMNRAELRELAATKGCEIGCHTVNHPMLAQQPVALQRREIFDSKAALEEILERKMKWFAYPYGWPPAVSEDTIGLAREAGFELAFDAKPGLIQGGEDPFLLPRFVVRDWGGAKFAEHLRGWLAA